MTFEKVYVTINRVRKGIHGIRDVTKKGVGFGIFHRKGARMRVRTPLPDPEQNKSRSPNQLDPQLTRYDNALRFTKYKVVDFYSSFSI